MRPGSAFNPRRRFCAAAETYENYAQVQSRAADRLIDLALSAAPPCATPERILEIGCGTGVLTRRLGAAFPRSRLIALDVAEGMIREARKLDGRGSRVKPSWLVGDAGHLPFRSGIDAVFSSSALHWAASPGQAIVEIGRVLKDGGSAAIALMVAGTLAELRDVRRRVAPDNLPVSDLPNAEQLLPAFHQAGLAMQRVVSDEIIMTYPRARDFLRALHEQGLTGGRFSSSGQPLSRTQLHQLMLAYDRDFAGPAGVIATYRIVWFFATKTGPAARGAKADGGRA